MPILAVGILECACVTEPDVFLLDAREVVSYDGFIRWWRSEVKPTLATLLRRALRLRCPLCGGRPIFLGWFTPCHSCPSCGLHLTRDNPGYWVGSSTIRLLVTQVLVVAAFGVGMLVTWPNVPWDLLLYGSIVIAMVLPWIIYPHAKAIHLAIDLAVHPPTESDLETPHERGFSTARQRRTKSG